MAELKERMGHGEFGRWRALYEVEGFGYRRFDVLFSLLSTLIANVNRDPKRSPFSLKDFVPDWWKSVEMARIPLSQKFKMITTSVGVENIEDGQS